MYLDVLWNSSGGSWLAKFGHVALYDASEKLALEVTNHHNVIRYVKVNSMTRNGYKGARYGKAYGWQADQVLGAGLDQRKYRPRYTVYTPYYTEGGWGYTWKFKWNKGFYKSWHVKRAKFRCDSFVNFCYKNGTGKLLVRQWTSLPYRVHHALPYRR